MNLANSNKKTQLTGEEKTAGKVNYLTGNDQSKWLTDIPTYQKVRYENVYSGIDLLYYGKQTQLEFDFIVSPGANPQQIKLDFEGARKIGKNFDGELVISLGAGEVILQAPILYQTDNRGERQNIEGEFALVDKTSVKFKVGEYDRARQLIIDPILSYSTFLPGANIGYDIAVDNDGNAVVTGNSSGGVPTTTGINTGGVFVTKFNPQGSNLIFSTRVGGNSGGSETGRAVKLDAAGNIIVAGSTSSRDFPAVNPVKGRSTFYVSTNAADSWSNNSDLEQYQVHQVAPSFQDANLLYAAAGNRIYRSTTGGTSWTNVTNNLPVSSFIQQVAVHPTNSAQVLTAAQNNLYRSNDGANSWTQISGATLPGTGVSAIVFDPNNPQIIYLAVGGVVRKTIDGGATWTSVNAGLPASVSITALAVNPLNSATLYAGTNTQGVYKSTNGGANWTAINTGISGNNSNIIRKLAIDPNNPSTVYIATGNYASQNLLFKTTNEGANWSLINTPFFSVVNSEIGAVAVSRTNSSRLYVGLLGGGFFRSNDGGVTWSRAQTGMWSSSISSIVESPTVSDKIYVGAGQESTSNDAFVFKLNPSGTAFVFSTTLGGSDYEDGYALAVDSQGNAYVGGTTKSFNFPAVNAFQTRHSSEGASYLSEDGFAAKIGSNGGTINYSTYLGGNSYDVVNGMAVDGAGKLVIAGKTQSPDFPIHNALQPTLRGIDGFLTKLSPSGNSIEFSTFWGTTGEDSGNNVKIDGSSNIILVGSATASGLPVVNALQPDFKGNSDGFISKLSPNGSQILFSTYLGGKDSDRIQDVDLDANGNIYVAGTSSSKDFPQLRSVKSRSLYFRSSNKAAKWTNFNTNVFSNIYDFAFHPVNPLIMFAASEDGLIKTTDGGDIWSKVTSAPTAFAYTAVEFNPQNPNVIYLAYRESSGANPTKVAVSNDGGATWNIFNQFAAGSDPIYKIFVSPTNPQIIYVATFFSIYKTVNEGATWERIIPFALWPVQDFAVSPTNPSTLFMARAYSDGGIYRSLDGGATWQKMLNGITGEYAEFVVIDPQQPSTIYARTSGGIFKSIDSGDSWALMQHPSAGHRLVIDPFSSSTLYLTRSLGATGSEYGLYRSTDGGNTWTIYNNGLPERSYFNRIEADPRLEGTFHGIVGLNASINDDIFISKIAPTGNALIYSSVLGGDIHTGNAFQDVAFGVAVNPNGSAFVTGGTTTTDFPTTPGAFYRTHNNTTLFVARFDPSWIVKGRITDQQTGNSIQGVNLTLNGNRVLTTETDGFGKYIFPNIAENDSFNLIPRKLGYDFTPLNYSISSINQDEVLNFTGVYTTYPIEGKVTFQGNPLPNVAVNLTGSQSGSIVTDGNGNFSFTVPKYGDYTVRPALNGYIFAPQRLTFNNVTSNLRADFAAREGFAIGGTILRNGSPVTGATVNLSGSEHQTTTTNSEGRYSFDAGANGDYQVMPLLEGLGFTPPSHSFSNLNSNQTGNFTAFRLPHVIDQITFARENSFSESQTEIFNIDDEGFDLQRVTTTSVSELQPAWSPNGRKLAYVSGQSGNFQLRVMNFNGTNDQTIVSNMSVSDPDWSPDSGKITFVGYDGSGSNIYIVNSDGSGLERITNNSSGNYNPNWSPDGAKIAFSSAGKIFTIKPDGSDLQRVTNSTLSEDEPDWSPNGGEIVFTGSTGSEPRIYLVRADGTNLRRLTGENQRENNPSWSLNGTRIAYLRGGTSGNVYTINIDGTGLRQITNDNLRKYNPVWKSRVKGSSFSDFDGDGKADVSVFRPENGVWYLLRSASGFTGTQFGISTDKIVPADYDGDGKTDVAVYRDGTWYQQRSSLGFTAAQFGTGEDIPVPADYDGDGKADVAVFRPSNGTWYLLQSTAGFTGIAFGQMSDKPVAADYDGDGKADVAVFRNGTWYVQRSHLGLIGFTFGESTDKPVPADYDGDGKADMAVFRPSNGTWYLQRSQLGFIGITFGLETDSPVPADYDGDGKTDVAVYRDGTWYLNRSRSGFTGIAFGAATDKPVPNAFVP